MTAKGTISAGADDPISDLLERARRKGPDDLHPFWSSPRPSQQDRYDRLMIATLDLAQEGGYEAIQMRAVASRSGVALGTAYTYFQSRDNLAYRAAIAWLSLLVAQAEDAAHTDLAPEADHVEALKHFMETLAPVMYAQPRMLETWVRSTMSSDPLVVAQRATDWSYWMRVMPRAPADQTEQVRERLQVLRDVLYAGLVRWAFNQDDLKRVQERTFATLDMLFDTSGSASLS